MKIMVTEHVNASIERVFEAFSDIENLAGRVSAINSVEVLSKNRTGEGVKWREVRTMFGKEASETMWMSHVDAPRSYAVEAESHGTKYYTTYTFTATETGTRVEMEFAGTPTTLAGRLMGLANFAFAGATKKMLQKDMAEIKAYIEHA